MEKQFHIQNRQSLYSAMENGTILILFSGKAPIKTADENYAFFADRNFVYLTGLTDEGIAFVAEKSGGSVNEKIFLLRPDMMAERWTGRRIKADEATEISGIENILYVDNLNSVIKGMAQSGHYHAVYLDFDRMNEDEPLNSAFSYSAYLKEQYPYLSQKNIRPFIRRLRTIKVPCEIEAMRIAEQITGEGIKAMMHASKPGIYEYQLKAEFDYALAQRGVLSPAFPSIISAGNNNFCIHYYGYRGIANDGDMILNDVGACWDDHNTDVSRGFPCNGKFSDKQKLLYECAYATSEHMFNEYVKPGIPMASVDAEIRRYNYERLKDIGLVKTFGEIGKYMWHGGAHHVGYDTHDVVDASLPVSEGMVFCIDVGIYVEEWGIGFRLEDNCLITSDGCENLSAGIPRSISEIEDEMKK